MLSVTNRKLTRQRGPESWTSCQEDFLRHYPCPHLASFHLLAVSPFDLRKHQAHPQNCLPSFAPWESDPLAEVAAVRSCLPPLELERARGRPLLSLGSSSCGTTPRTWRRRRLSWKKSLRTWRWRSWRNLICDSLTHALTMRRMNWSLTWTWMILKSSPWVT